LAQITRNKDQFLWEVLGSKKTFSATQRNFWQRMTASRDEADPGVHVFNDRFSNAAPAAKSSKGVWLSFVTSPELFGCALSRGFADREGFRFR